MHVCMCDVCSICMSNLCSCCMCDVCSFCMCDVYSLCMCDVYSLRMCYVHSSCMCACVMFAAYACVICAAFACVMCTAYACVMCTAHACVMSAKFCCARSCALFGCVHRLIYALACRAVCKVQGSTYFQKHSARQFKTCFVCKTCPAADDSSPTAIIQQALVLGSIHPDSRAVVYAIAAMSGSTDLFAKLQALYSKVSGEQLRTSNIRPAIQKFKS